jgi:translation initiation factor 2 subunit 2
MATKYEDLLSKAYSKLPTKAVATERFEPPTIESFMQGNKTIVKNFDMIVSKCRREPGLLVKYLSRELAVPATVDGGRLVLHGKFYDRILNEKLNNFINTYVLCKECKKPDTKLVDYEGVKMLVCEACGARGPVK